MSLLRSALRPALVRPIRPAAVAGFQTSAARQILPAGPQEVQGTINDPAPIPESHPSEGSYHWTFERALALGLIPLTIAPFAAGSLHPITDAALGAAVVMHSHLGFQQSIIDYIPRRKYQKSYKALMWTLNAATVGVLYGLYEFETNDVGVTEAVKRIWKA